jgi:hypothetical protein
VIKLDPKGPQETTYQGIAEASGEPTFTSSAKKLSQEGGMSGDMRGDAPFTAFRQQPFTDLPVNLGVDRW